MSFEFSEAHIAGFHTLGYTVFRSIIPPALLSDLRREADKAREIARTKGGPQAQRLQPVGKYDLDQRPFQDYAELPALSDAIARIISPRHRIGHPDLLGILFEPAEMPWCTPWHRDLRDHMPREVFEAEFKADWDKQVFDINHMNQINCALYEDGATWFVPGSHYRQENLPGEVEARGSAGEEALRGNNVGGEGRTAEEQERFCLQYTSRMPGAVQLLLNAGDFALYRPCAWHMGSYVPYRKRATLHDAPLTPEGLEARARQQPRLQKAMEQYRQAQTAENTEGKTTNHK